MPKSLRKFIRFEKARIRRDILEVKDQESLIGKLYDSLAKKEKTASEPGVIDNKAKEKEKNIKPKKQDNKNQGKKSKQGKSKKSFKGKKRKK